MKLGIVGHAAEKFTPKTETAAKDAIRILILHHAPTHVVSGGYHMGGIDIWTEEVACTMRVPVIVHKPKRLTWAGSGGFRERNVFIARDSDLVACIVVKDLPSGFSGMRFDDCYHCKGMRSPHVKSGGCWTAKLCKGGGVWVIL